MMIAHTEVEEIIRDLFEEEALMIGGLVVLHRPEDDLVWRLIRNLDVIRQKALRRLEASEDRARGDGPPQWQGAEPHPAVEEFLFKLRREEEV